MAQITLNSTGVASSGALALQSNGTTTAVTIDASQNVGIGTSSPSKLLDVAGNAAITGTGVLSLQRPIVPTFGQGTPQLTFQYYTTGTTYTTGAQIQALADGSWSSTSAPTNMLFYTCPSASTTTAERMRINSSGNVGIGTSSPNTKLHITGDLTIENSSNTPFINFVESGDNTDAKARIAMDQVSGTAGDLLFYTEGGGTLAERARIDSSGDLLVGKTSGGDISVNGIALRNDAFVTITTSGGTSLYINRNTNDGELVQFRQANTAEGSISVSGTTVTYGGGHLARFGQLPDGSEDPTLLKGTVLTNLDEMCVWINKETGIPADNEQCNKVKISDVDGDANVAGVFVSWSYDEQHETNDLFVAMTGDMIIRIAQGVTVARGDLLMSAGDGTAKPQGDDIIRSKTVAKVTSTHVTCTYADGSYCVPCVLMAC